MSCDIARDITKADANTYSHREGFMSKEIRRVDLYPEGTLTACKRDTFKQVNESIKFSFDEFVDKNIDPNDKRSIDMCIWLYLKVKARLHILETEQEIKESEVQP